MAIDIGGGSFGPINIGSIAPLLDQNNRMNALAMQAQAEANAQNQQQAAQTHAAGAAGYAADMQNQALDRQAQMQAQEQQRQDTQMQMQQQQQDQTAQFHKDEVQRQNDALDAQKQWHADDQARMVQSEQARMAQQKAIAEATDERQRDLRSDSIDERSKRDQANSELRDNSQTEKAAEEAAFPFNKQAESELISAQRADAMGADATPYKQRAQLLFQQGMDAKEQTRQLHNTSPALQQYLSDSNAVPGVFNASQNPPQDPTQTPTNDPDGMAYFLAHGGAALGGPPQAGVGSVGDFSGTEPDNSGPKSVADVRNEKSQAAQDKAAEQAREHAEIEAVHKAAVAERERKQQLADLPYTDLTTQLQAEPDPVKRAGALQAAEITARGKLPPDLRTDEQIKGGAQRTTGNPTVDADLQSFRIEAKELNDAGNMNKVTGEQLWMQHNKPDKEALHAVLRAKKEFNYAPPGVPVTSAATQQNTPATGVDAGFQAAQARTARANAGLDDADSTDNAGMLPPGPFGSTTPQGPTPAAAGAANAPVNALPVLTPEQARQHPEIKKFKTVDGRIFTR